MNSQNNKYILLTIFSFVLWGLFPLYFKLLETVSSFEIILHRVLWSCIIMGIIVLFHNNKKEFLQIIKNKRTLIKLTFSGLLITTNWLVFVYAVNTNRILETSLGYYTSPLFTIFLGIIFLKEKVGTIKKIAISLTICSFILKLILVQNLSYITIVLALTFSGYSLIKKTVKENSIISFLVELMILSIPASIMLASKIIHNESALNAITWPILLLLIGTGIVTISPLILFNSVVRHIDLSIIGFFQYLTPTMTFIFAILIYHEKFNILDLMVFALIWIAIFLVRFESYKNNKISNNTKENNRKNN